jgi:hypothetical protein
MKTSDPAGIPQAINLCVRNRIAILHPLVMSDRDQFVSASQCRANGNTTFAAALLRLIDCRLHEPIRSHTNGVREMVAAIDLNRHQVIQPAEWRIGDPPLHAKTVPRFWSLKFEVSLGFGVWCLGFSRRAFSAA